MKTRFGVAVAIVASLMPWNAEVALAGKPGPRSAWDISQACVYRTGSLACSTAGIRQYPSPVSRQSLGRTYSVRRSPMGRPGTVIVAPAAETIIIYQEGSGRQHTRIVTQDGVYDDDWFFDRDAFPSQRRIYRPSSGIGPSYSPYPYGNSRRHSLPSCYPASWRNSAFRSLSARQSCYETPR